MKEANQMDKKIGRATLWSTITEFSARLITPIANMILARLLTPEAFGVVATITMVISFAEIFSDAGFQKYIVQHEFRSQKELDDNTTVAFWTNLGLSSICFLLIFIFRDVIGKWVGAPDLGYSICVAAISIILHSFSSIHAARLRRALAFNKIFYARIGSSLVSLLVTVPLAYLIRNYWALIIGTLAANAFNAICLSAVSDWKPRIIYNGEYFKNMISFSIWTLMESLSIWLNGYIGTFIVGNVLSDYYLGIYKTSISTVNSYMALITASVTPVIFSSLSRYQYDEEKFQDTYYTFQRLSAVLLMPMGIGIYVYREFVTQILLGSQWMEACDFIGLWGLISAFVIVLGNFNSEVYRSKGKPSISFAAQLLHLAFLIPTLLIGVRSSFSVLCTARALIRIQSIIVDLILIKYVFHFSLAKIIKNVVPTIISAGIMGIFGYILRQLNNSFVWESVTVVLCIVLYFLVLFCFFPQYKKELLNIGFVKQFFSKMQKRNKK